MAPTNYSLTRSTVTPIIFSSTDNVLRNNFFDVCGIMCQQQKSAGEVLKDEPYCYCQFHINASDHKKKFWGYKLKFRELANKRTKNIEICIACRLGIKK